MGMALEELVVRIIFGKYARGDALLYWLDAGLLICFWWSRRFK